MADCDMQIHSRLSEVEAIQRSHVERLDAHGREIDELKLSVTSFHASTSEKLNRIDQTVDRIDRRLETEESRPAENWRELVKQVTGYVLAAVAALVLLKVGLQP